MINIYGKEMMEISMDFYMIKKIPNKVIVDLYHPETGANNGWAVVFIDILRPAIVDDNYICSNEYSFISISDAISSLNSKVNMKY